MTGFTLVWIVSWTLSGLALALLLGLIGYRALANRRLAAERLERGNYIELLKARTEPASVSGEPADDVLTDLTVQILELVRGDEKARFAERMTKAGTAARLRERLRRGNARLRILTAAALTNFKDEVSRAALTSALGDRNAEVRLTAALSLAANGQAPPPAELIRRLGIGEQESSLRTIMLLADLADNDLENVRALLRDPSIPPPIKAATARALAINDDFPSVPAVAALAMETDPRARELPLYLEALAQFEHPAGSPAVLCCLGSASAPVRAAAAYAAGRIGIEAALDRLENLLGDSDWWVRVRTAQALVRLGAGGQQRLRHAAGHAAEPARETAAVILAELESAP